MSPSFEAASTLYDWANGVLVGAAAVGVASTILVIWMGNVKEGYLRRDLSATHDRIAQLNHETEQLRAENLGLQKTLLPRRIAMMGREGDNEIRAARFLEVKKYAGTLALIQSVPDFEAQILASDIRTALANSGWNAVITNEAQSHIPLGGVTMEGGVLLVTLEAPLLSGSPPVPTTHPFSRASQAAHAVVNLLNLDLGPPNGPTFFGVHWEAEYTGDLFSPILTRYGFKFPDDAVVIILVGMRPVIFSGAAPASPATKVR